MILGTLKNIYLLCLEFPLQLKTYSIKKERGQLSELPLEPIK